MQTDTYEHSDTSRFTFVTHYKSMGSSKFMKMDCKSYRQAPAPERMGSSVCVGPPGCSWNMYAVSGSVEPLRIELGGRLLLMAATAAPQPSGNWNILSYLWKFNATFCTGHTKAEKNVSSVKLLSCIGRNLHLFKWFVSMNVVTGKKSLYIDIITCFTISSACICSSVKFILIIIQKELCI